MKKRLLVLLLGIFFVTVQALAQTTQKVVSGKVTDEDAVSLPGVSVKIKGTTTGTQTGADGVYSIQASQGQVLVFSFIGTITQERTVGTDNTLNVSLRSDSKSLTEVVVTAFGITREKKALGYAAQIVKGDDVAASQRDNFLNALQGRVAGATITASTGEPGASAQIILRGAVSFDGDNQPLFVVDGLPISNRTFSQSNLVSNGANRNADYSNRALDINPSDIESITILKGPEAAALYGTDGASGAIVITTKKSKSGEGSISYDNSFRAENVYRFPEVQTTYGPGFSGFNDPEIRTFFGPRVAEGTQTYDNIGNFFKTGFTQKHNLILAGGTEQASFRLSTNYTDQDGVVPLSAFKKFSTLLSASAKISQKLNVSAFLNYVNSKVDRTPKGADNYFLSLLSWPAIDDARNYLTPEGNRRYLDKDPTDLAAEIDNPYWNIYKNINSDRTDRLIGNVTLSFDPVNWLNITGRLGADIYSTLGNSLLHPQSKYGIAAKGKIENYTENSRLMSGSTVLSAKKTWGKFSPVLRLGGDFSDNRYETNSTYGEKFYEPDFNSINNTDPITQRFKNSLPIKRKVGVFANAEFGYDQFLYLTLTGRMDGSSTLHGSESSLYFFYPATSLSFVFSELESLKNINWLSFGKLRGSYGLTGKDPRTAYITRSRLVPQGTTGGGFAVDVTGGNSKLKAEFTKSFEVGTEMKFLKDSRLGLDFSYYTMKSDKQITAPRLSYGSGYVLQWINGGEITNKGFELEITGTPILKKDFSWDASARFSRNRGKITKMPADLSSFYVSDTWLYAGVRAEYKLGTSVSALAANRFLRNDKGDVLISPSTGLPIRDGVYYPFAERAPDLLMGVTNSFTYKSVNLSFLLDIRKGGDIFNGNELYMYTRGISKLTLDRETPRVVQGVLRDGLENTANPTPNNIVITPYLQNSYYSVSYSEEDFIERDVNWVRLKDITLAYNLSAKMLSRRKLFSSASVFVTGTDLFMITNYKGADPNVSGLNASAGGAGGGGIDYGALATPRGISFGLKLGL